MLASNNNRQCTEVRPSLVYRRRRGRLLLRRRCLLLRRGRILRHVRRVAEKCKSDDHFNTVVLFCRGNVFFESLPTAEILRLQVGRRRPFRINPSRRANELLLKNPGVNARVKIVKFVKS